MKHLPCQFRRRRRTSERNSARRFGSISPSCADQNTTWRAQLIIWKRGSTEPSFQPRLWMCQRSFVGNCSFISAACSREPNLIFNIICRLSLEAGPRGRPDVRAPRVRNLETLPNPLKLLGSVAAVGLVLIKSCCARLTKPDEKVIKTYQSQTAQQIVLSAAAEAWKTGVPWAEALQIARNVMADAPLQHPHRRQPLRPRGRAWPCMKYIQFYTSGLG